MVTSQEGQILNRMSLMEGEAEGTNIRNCLVARVPWFPGQHIPLGQALVTQLQGWAVSQVPLQ